MTKKIQTSQLRWHLGERVTTEISVAQRGGKVVGNARKETEEELGRSVISDKKFLESDGKLKLE